ncbi:MAG: hypothetical protein N0A16_06235 [Blastocatellia bacterium]|nr:hypothetical protein [Blastocatellia bacterium]MCS7157309.1 hypothetical protein [Blastocatellia bacterium]MCX7752014.1 hypothetical protein [Blastocatellia bacterium]MDW8167120.1 hypothetical protein [Acidobacteriota bacterium]MDW8257224.1 hypothetical protein [Acidobacteriota bacterium]
MNKVRIVLGGLVAGVIINAIETVVHRFLFRSHQELGREPLAMSGAILIWIVGLVFGIMLAWLYAAIRPRYGAGPKTAILAGFYLWIVAGLLVWIGFSPLLQWGMRLMIIGIVTNLVAYIVAALVAGYLYKKEEVAAA